MYIRSQLGEIDQNLRNIFLKFNEVREGNYLKEFVYIYNFSSYFLQVQVVCRYGNVVYVLLGLFIYMFFCYRVELKQFFVLWDDRKYFVKDMLLNVFNYCRMFVQYFRIYKVYLNIIFYLIILIIREVIRVSVIKFLFYY